MDIRKFILIIAGCLCLQAVRGQRTTLMQADSVSQALYAANDWQQLIKVGEAAIQNKIDFIALRKRLGYAYFITGNYAAALKQYAAVFKTEPDDQISRYYASLCSSYLNDLSGESYNAAYFYKTRLGDKKLKPFDVIEIGLESGAKYNSDTYRGTALYNRISLGLRLSWRLLLDQSVIYFTQPVSAPDTVVERDHRMRTITPTIIDSKDNEFEYYGKLSFALNRKLVILGAYHYLGTKYFYNSYYSNLGLLGIKYAGNYFTTQADVDFGRLINHGIVQYNAGLVYYPLGNLNLYGGSRFSYELQNNDKLAVFNQSVGFKALRNTWLETTATFGKLDNYIDADELYIYNSIDISTFKLSETVFYLLGKHAQFQLNYTFEKKQDAQNNIRYNQASVTAGVLWKF